MPILLRVRQKKRNTRRGNRSRDDEERSLVHAFATFTPAADSLDLSNADIATEFSQLILAGRGYEANAKAITTFDQVTQDAINLKQ